MGKKVIREIQIPVNFTDQIAINILTENQLVMTEAILSEALAYISTGQKIGRNSPQFSSSLNDIFKQSDAHKDALLAETGLSDLKFHPEHYFDMKISRIGDRDLKSCITLVETISYKFITEVMRGEVDQQTYLLS